MKTNFDDILKRKLEQQHFPVDQTHRQEMIDLLNSQRRRKPFPFWWLGGLVTVVAIAGLYFYIADSNAKPTNGSPEKIQNNITAPSESETMAAANHEMNSSSEDKLTEGTTNEPSVNGSVMPKIQNSELNDQNQNHPNVKPSDMPSTKDLSVAKLATADSKKVATSDQAGLSVSPSAQGDQLQDGILNDLNRALDQTLNSNVRSAAISNKNKADEQMDLRMHESVMILESAEMTGIDYISTNPTMLIEPADFKGSFFVFGETGFGFVFGSKPDFEAGWKYRLGAGLGFNFSPKLQFTLSGGYLYQNGGFDFQRLSTVNQPGFGTRSSFNTLTPDKLHFVYGKAGAQTRTHRHIFAAHAGMQLLYGAQGDITTMVNDQFLGMKELNEYTWLKTSGLRTLHWTADFAYGYQITSHLSVTVGADYYFSSFTVEDPSLESEGFTWSGAYSPFQPFINLNYLLHGRL